MTHHMPSFNVKVFTDAHGGRWYLFFRTNVTEPFMCLPEFDVETLAGHYENREGER